MTIVAATDGSALGNPGPAGWAWYVDEGCWAAGGWPHGTNNMGELTAVLDLLQQTAHVEEPLEVYADSTYVINVITKWMAGWKRKGWRKGDGKPVLNVEIIKAIDAAMVGRTVTFHWVKGHAGHPLNEAADERANAIAVSFRDGTSASAGPGFSGGTSALPDAKVRQTVAEPDLFSELESAELVDPLAEVVELERSLLTDEVRSDAAEVAALLHPQWQEIGSSGTVWSREEMLARIAPIPTTAMEVISVEEVVAGAVLLVWRSTSDQGSRLRSSVWVRVDGRWLQRFHQGTVE